MATGGMRGGPRHMAGLLEPKVKAKNTRLALKRLLTYLESQQMELIKVFFLVVGSSAAGLAGPYLIGRGIDRMVGGRGNVDFAGLAVTALILLFIYAVSALMSGLQIYLMVGIAQRIIRDLRRDLFAKVQTLPLRFFDGRPDGELMSRLTNDVESINNALTQSTSQIFSSFLLVAGSLIMMLLLSPLLTVLTLVSLPLGVVVTGKIAGRTRKSFSAQQKELGELNGFIEETISGQRVIKAFSQEKNVLRDFGAINEQLKKAGTQAQIFSGIVMPTMFVVNNISFALVAGAGGWMAVKGILTIGIIASFLNYSKQFARPINEIANQYNMIQSALAGAERVFEIMDEEPEKEDEPGALTLKNPAGDVVFADVHFRYQEDVPVLKSISLQAHPGQTVALVGPTGAGKTTLVNLITRFYDIDQGTIFIDGKEIRTIKKDSLRSSLGIVLQDTYLFSDTVRENIRYGRLNATNAEVEAAARLANAHPFIQRLPDGYDTLLSEDGGNLSQGQRQLLTIARAILADPAILILDEATSSVDTRTEMHIQQAMLELMKGRTSFVIAHRLSTIRNADQILLINDGKIIEQGSHHQLLAAKGFYHRLYHSQYKREAS